MQFLQLVFANHICYCLSFTDDDGNVDAEPEEQYLTTFRTKLRDLAKILDDAYLPSESYKINQKLASMQRMSLFVSFIVEIGAKMRNMYFIKLD